MAPAILPLKSRIRTLVLGLERTFIGRTATASAWIAASMVIQLGLEKAFLQPYLSRMLTRAEFGSFILARSISTITAGALAVGVSNTLLREHAGLKEEDKEALWRTGVLINLIFLSILALALVAMARPIGDLFHDAPTGKLMFGFAAYSLVFGANSVFITYYYMRLEIGKLVAMQALMGIGYLTAIPLARFFGLPGVSWGYFLGTSAVSAVIMTRLGKIFGRRPFWIPDKARAILRDMWPLAASTTFLFSMQWTDRLVIGHYLSTSLVAYYFISTSIAYLFLTPFEALSGALLGTVASQREPQDISHSTRRLIRLGTLLVAPSSVILVGATLGPWVMDLFYGPGSFARGKTYYFVLLLGVAFSSSFSVARSFVTIFRDASLVFWMNLGSFLMNVIANVVLGKFFGLLGVAIATTLSQIFRCALFWRSASNLLKAELPAEKLSPIPAMLR